jgi:hypothetical protein
MVIQDSLFCAGGYSLWNILDRLFESEPIFSAAVRRQRHRHPGFIRRLPISAWQRLQVTNFRFRVQPPIPGGARQSACSSLDRRACTHSIGLGSSCDGGGSKRGGRTARTY